MKVLLFALLAAISYAQTATGAAPSGGSQPVIDPMYFGMYDEVMDLGDMYDFGDFGDMFMPYMQGLNFGGGSTGGAGGSGGILDQIGAMQMPFFDGDLSDMMSDVVDNMKDGDIQDVMSNLLPMAQMGLPGLDINSIMQGGMPNLNGIMQGLTPYLAMDGDLGDLYGDLGDLYNFGSDVFEDYMAYGGMGGMPGMGGLAGASTKQLRKARLHNKLRRRRTPNRLLKKTRTNRRLRKPREFPWYAFSNLFTNKQSGQSGSSSMLPFYDGIDSEDLQTYLMMGGNRKNIPPPVDGIDTEDLWMYRGTQWDPMNYYNKATGKTTNADGTAAKTTVNPWIWAMLSGLQKAHMQKKY